MDGGTPYGFGAIDQQVMVARGYTHPNMQGQRAPSFY
jgi:hypothetical protein